MKLFIVRCVEIICYIGFLFLVGPIANFATRLAFEAISRVSTGKWKLRNGNVEPNSDVSVPRKCPN